jgi:hypothetical protein
VGKGEGPRCLPGSGHPDGIVDNVVVLVQEGSPKNFDRLAVGSDKGAVSRKDAEERLAQRLIRRKL